MWPNNPFNNSFNNPFNNPFRRSKTTGESLSTKNDSDPTTNKDTPHPSIPSKLPAVVVEKINSQNNVFPIQYYNCTLYPYLNTNEAILFELFPHGRWTFNNLPEVGVLPFGYEPMVKVVADPPPVVETSKNPVVKTGSCCCLLQRYVLSLILFDMAMAR